MVEELYIFDKNGMRRSVDLNSPSGITLKWVSNMFNSLDKVNCSYSYTFKIPMTQHNREVFDFAEDIRHTSGLLGKKLKAEFIQNGIPLFRNGNLYIDKSTADSYSCVFTWDVIEGLQKLKDDSCSLNELRDALVKAGYESDELKEEGMVEWGNDPILTPEIMTIFDNSKKILRPYYLNLPSDPNYSEYLSMEASKVYSQGVPKPVMPVRYLIECINKAYGVTFDMGKSAKGKENLPTSPISKWLYDEERIITYGCIPLTGVDVTENQQKQFTKKLVYNSSYGGDYRLLGTFIILTFEKNKDVVYPYNFYSKQKINYIAYQAYDYKGDHIGWDFPSSEKELQSYYADTIDKWNDSKYVCVGIEAPSFCKIKMEGSFSAIIYKRNYDDFFEPLKIHVYSWKVVNRGTTDEHIERVDVASYGPVSITPSIDDDGTEIYITTYNFNEDEGFEPASFQNEEAYNADQSTAEYWLGFEKSYFTRQRGELNIERQFSFTPKFDDIDYDAHIIDTFTNLPDIDCLSFMKSLFYMVGGFPYVNSNGTIKTDRYDTLKENIRKGFVYNWSDRVISHGWSGYDEISYHNDFKQNNYYMSKWDDLDRTSSDLKEEDDLYEDGIGNIKVEDNTLDKVQTVQQVPFYPPYILNRKCPMITDRTIKQRNFNIADNNYSLDVVGRLVNSNKGRYIESKPAYGYVHRIPFFDPMKVNRIKPWSENYNTSADLVRMSVLNPFKDIMMNPSYRYLQKIVEHPFVITEKLLLNEFDLMDIDYVKPVYLEKYNSYFAIISIQRDSKGVCKCELIKLPTYVPPIKVTLSIESQYSKFLHYKVSSTSKEDKTITIGFIIENSKDGQYVQHSKVNLKGDSFQFFNPTSNTEWVIKEVWLDHYEEGDYNDYEFQIG